MKLTRRELNTLIESYLIEEEYLLNEKLRKAVRGSVYVPTCDFKPDPEFLEIYKFIQAGGKKPRKGFDADTGKPDVFNPLFLKSLTGQLLPFMNLLVTPQVGLKAKCNLMRRMQNIFNDMYSEFSSGFETQTQTDSLTDKEKQAAAGEVKAGISKLYTDFFSDSTFSDIIRSSKVRITPERNSAYLDPGGKIPSGLSRNELYYASLILGNLSKTQENASSIRRILSDFSSTTARNDSDIFKLTRAGKSIPGYDEVGLKALFRTAVSAFRRDQSQGANNIVQITNKLFNNLKSAGIL